MTEVNGLVEVNECILANVTAFDDEESGHNVSRLNLLIQLNNNGCFEAIQTGRLYLRGLCLASNDMGATSETFVLDVIDSQVQITSKL